MGAGGDGGQVTGTGTAGGMKLREECRDRTEGRGGGLRGVGGVGP